jgi:ubiquinone/menaquinone biosynthesis C-methylase UbiE
MRIKTEDVVLDVGYGSDYLILSLAVRAGFVIGLDISKNSLYVAMSHYMFHYMFQATNEGTGPHLLN